MTPRKPLPEIACPCGKANCAGVIQPMIGQFRVVTSCGFAGPIRYTSRACRVSWNRWNRRAPDADAERCGARETLEKLQEHAEEMKAASLADKSNEWAEACEYFSMWAQRWLQAAKAIERGEVLPAKAKKASKRI